jgi:hypothetical protein
MRQGRERAPQQTHALFFVIKNQKLRTLNSPRIPTAKQWQAWQPESANETAIAGSVIK